MLLYALVRVFVALAAAAAVVCVACAVAAVIILALPIAGVVYWVTGKWVLTRGGKS